LGPTPQPPTPQSPIPNPHIYFYLTKFMNVKNIFIKIIIIFLENKYFNILKI